MFTSPLLRRTVRSSACSAMFMPRHCASMLPIRQSASMLPIRHFATPTICKIKQPLFGKVSKIDAKHVDGKLRVNLAMANYIKVELSPSDTLQSFYD